MYSLDDPVLATITSSVSDETFQSTYTLSSDETSAVQIALEEFKLQRGTLNVKIKELKKLITVYKNVRKQVSLSISRHTYLLSAIRRLPPELLVEIFRWIIFENPRNRSRKEKLAPMLLSQVCKLWRLVLRDTPSLWTRVEADLTDQYKYEEQLVDLWVRRSGEQSLDITVLLVANSRFSNPHRARKSILSPEEQETLSNRTCELLLKHSSRWRTFRLWAQRALPPCFCHPALLPLLVRADVEVDWGSFYIVDTLLQFFQKAEHLKVFNLDGKDQYDTALPDILVSQPSAFRDWSFIREMDLRPGRDFGSDSVVEILRRSPRLQRFAVKVYRSRHTDQHVFSQPFRHDSLQSLEVHHYVSFLRALEAPNLKELRVYPKRSSNPNSSSSDFEDAVRCFSRRTPQIEKVVIDSIRPSCIEYCWQTVQYLSMSMDIDSRIHLNLLESWADQTSRMVSPSLRTLCLNISAEWHQEVNDVFFCAVHNLAKQLLVNVEASSGSSSGHHPVRAFPSISSIYVDLQGCVAIHEMDELYSRSEALVNSLRDLGLKVMAQRLDCLTISSAEVGSV